MKKTRLTSARDLFPSVTADDHNNAAEDDRPVNGRQRVFPHKRNQFLVHFYAELSEDLNDFLDKICDKYRPKYPTIEFLADRHVSLVDGLRCLRFHEIDCFWRSIESKIERKGFELKFLFNSFRVFENQSENRFFLTFGENSVKNHLNCEFSQIIEHVFSRELINASEGTRQLRALEMTYHVSVASTGSGHREELLALEEELNEDLECFVIRVSEICVKVGNYMRKIRIK